MPVLEVPHGSAMGYRLGCRSKSGCALHRSIDFLTCVEAANARRADFALARLPEDRVIPRPGSVKRAENDLVIHGSSEGFLLGCRDSRLCPGAEAGLTCAEAHKENRAKVARGAGIAPRAASLDSERASALIRRWLDGGRSIRQIAAQTGCGTTTIAALADVGRSERRHVRPSTLIKILEADPLR